MSEANERRPLPLHAAEVAATQKRRLKCRQALLDFLARVHPDLANEVQQHVPVGSETSPLDRAPDALPRIGLVISGGGWRAMTAATAAADELSRIGLLDTVEIVGGLSGSSWFVQNWALGGESKNVFHDTATRHPWAYRGRFNPDEHRYRGLVSMLSKDVVRMSAQVPPLLNIGKFSEYLSKSDLTFFRMLMLGNGGDSMISRYASFLDRQLLSWQSADERAQNTFLQNDASAAPISDGTFPMLAVAAIHTVNNNNGNNAAAGNNDQSTNVWTEFTPFGARSPIVNAGATYAIPTARVQMDGRMVPLTAGRLMGVCGSAFAVDMETVLSRLPSGAAHLVRLLGVDETEANVLLNNALTETYVRDAQANAGEVLFGRLRDAGFDFNVPFPLVLKKSSGRMLDIVIAIDAGHEATGAAELALAVQYGYIEIEGHTVEQLRQAFPPGDRVRVFYPPQDSTTGLRSGPIIVYAVVLNSTKSWKIAYTQDEVIACTSLVRQTIRDQVAAEVIRTVREFAVNQLTMILPDTRERLLQGGNIDAALQGGDVGLDAPGAVDDFSQLTAAALLSLVQDPATHPLNLSPLDVVQRIERELLGRIPGPLRAAVVRRVATLAMSNGTFNLTTPLDVVDGALTASKWVVAIDGTSQYTFADATLYDYARAVNAVLVLTVPPQTPLNLANVLNRPSELIEPLTTINLPQVFEHNYIVDPAFRFVFTNVAMLASTMAGAHLGLSTALVDKLVRVDNIISNSRNNAVISNLPIDACLRYDRREEARRALGVSAVIESFCFLIDGDESCAANERLFTMWEHRINGNDDGRFAYFVLEGILSSARGVRCRRVVSALLPRAIAFLRTFGREESSLLAVALYCSSFRNGGNIELLRAAGVEGNLENPAQLCTLLDACTVGNHNAVEMMLKDITNGAPPISAVQRAVNDHFPKVVDALISDNEATEPFLRAAYEVLRRSRDFAVQLALIERRTARM